MSITNTIDTDLIVLFYVEPSILAYMKTINSNFYRLLNDILDDHKFKLTKALINTPQFLENNFDNIKINKMNLLTVCVKNELNLDGLKWLYYKKKCKPNKWTFEYAAKNGKQSSKDWPSRAPCNFDVLKWMLDNNFPKNEKIFAYAAKNGNFDVLKWMLDNNFPKDEETFKYAAKNGNFNILKWMLNNNFPKDERTFAYAAENGKQSYNECGSLSRQSPKDWPLWAPCNLDILKWMFDNNFPKDERAFAYAALNGNLDILKWMFHNNFPKDELTFAYAAEYGSFDNLKWMFDNHFPKDKNTFAYAAKNGNLNNLKWMLHNNFPKDEETFKYAAKNGNLNNMKWLFDNNFPKDEWTFVKGVFNGNFDNLKWMFDNNFPKDKTTFEYAIENVNLDILKWMIDNNFPYYKYDYDRYITLCKKKKIIY